MSKLIKKGSWVQIHRIILKPEERAPQVPADTKKVPLEMWVKGFLCHDANIGDEVEIKTITGRIETGELVTENPSFKHHFGEFVPEILKIGEIVKNELFGDEIDE